jgi:hypothetical protein
MQPLLRDPSNTIFRMPLLSDLARPAPAANPRRDRLLRGLLDSLETRLLRCQLLRKLREHAKLAQRLGKDIYKLEAGLPDSHWPRAEAWEALETALEQLQDGCRLAGERCLSMEPACSGVLILCLVCCGFGRWGCAGHFVRTGVGMKPAGVCVRVCYEECWGERRQNMGRHHGCASGHTHPAPHLWLRVRHQRAETHFPPATLPSVQSRWHWRQHTALLQRQQRNAAHPAAPTSM